MLFFLFRRWTMDFS